MGSTNPVILHIHIPKTAGTSLNSALSEAFDGQKYAYTDQNIGIFFESSKEDREKINFAFGHFDYGLHKYLRQNYINVFVARNPKNRIYSYYRYLCRTQDHPLYKNVQGLDFGQFLNLSLQNKSIMNEIDNGQMRRISGIGNLNEANKQYAFFLACANVLKPTSIVGLTEQYAKFLAVLHGRGILPSIDQQNLNATVSKLEKYTLNDSQKALLDRYIKWDDLFYKHCSVVFESYR